MKPVTPAAAPALTAPAVEALKTLLRSEMAAVETYELALAQFEDHAFYGDLRTIRHHHESAAGVLRDLVRNLGGEPAEGPGAWETFVTSVSAADKKVGPESVLDALCQGEEH